MKNQENYYREVSEELNLPLGLVKAVNNFYWKEGIKNNLSNVNYSSIFIKNLGTIVVSKYKLYKEILTLIRKIRNIEYSQKYTPLKKSYIIEGYKTNLRRLLKMRNELIVQNELN